MRRRGYIPDDAIDVDVASDPVRAHGARAGHAREAQQPRLERARLYRRAPYARAPPHNVDLVLRGLATAIEEGVPVVRGVLSHGQRAYMASTIRRLVPERAHLLAIAQGGMSDFINSHVAATAAARIAGDILGASANVTGLYNSPPRSATVGHHRPGSVAAPGAPRALRRSTLRPSSLSSRAQQRLESDDDDEFVVSDDDEFEVVSDDDDFEVVSDDESLSNGESVPDASEQEDVARATAASLGFAYRRGHPVSSALLRHHAEAVALAIAGATAGDTHDVRAPGDGRQARQRRYDDPSANELAHRRARAEMEHPHAEEIKRKFPSMVCPITHDVFRDPVVASDGHTYERSAIERWLGTANTSPVTNETLRDRTLHDNVLARNLIAESAKTH